MSLVKKIEVFATFATSENAEELPTTIDVITDSAQWEKSGADNILTFKIPHKSACRRTLRALIGAHITLEEKPITVRKLRLRSAITHRTVNGKIRTYIYKASAKENDIPVERTMMRDIEPENEPIIAFSPILEATEQEERAIVADNLEILSDEIA